MTDHKQAAMDFLHSSEWLNAGDIFAQQKAIADFAASLAPRPSDSHKQEAREIARIYAAESEGIRDGCERAIELLCARVERETRERTIEECALLIARDVPYPVDHRDTVYACCDSIRALADEDAK